MQKVICFLISILILTGCDHTTDEADTLLNRTVLIYISGENSLSSFIGDELAQMRQGSMDLGNNALVVYVDDNSSRKPYIIRLQNGQTVDSMAMESDPLSSDPEVMGDVLRYVSDHYPANDYGLVLWGHASGWVLQDSVAWARTARKAYGIDNGRNSSNDSGLWLNMNSLGRIITDWGQPLKFIIADCCQFQCIESAYELRNATDYIIGSPAEIPGEGAPYHTMIPPMFDTTDDFYRRVVDTYYQQRSQGYDLPLSVIKTSELETLAAATHSVLSTFAVPAEECPDLHGLIYYKGLATNLNNDVMYDMNDFVLHFAPADAYQQWKAVFDQTVIYKKKATYWMSYAGGGVKQVNFNSFTVTDERFGGVSMFVPQNRDTKEYKKYNADIKKTAWYWAVGMQDFGW